MFILHLFHIVLVASCAIVNRVAGAGVASGAFQHALLAVVQREGVLAQLGGQPRFCCVAVGTVGAKNAKVNFWLGVAGDAFTGCAQEHLVLVADGTFSGGMLAFQWENGGVVKIAHAVQPIVAILAAWAKKGGVFGDEDGNGRSVTLFTRRVSYWNWVFTFVAMGTTHLTTVKISDVAGKAEAGGALMVKRLAIDGGGLPGDGSVTAGAIGAKHCLMICWFGMAGNAFLWRAFKFATRVAAFAICGFVGTRQGKQISVLSQGKVRHRVQAVVAIETVGSICLVVPGHKVGIQFAVAACAGAVLHSVVAFINVAIGAGDFGADIFDVVVGQAES